MFLFHKKEKIQAKEKIAILYICTGKYVVFWKQFYRSMEKRFLQQSIVEYFVFTDAASIYAEEDEHVHKVEQKLLGWPYDTLMRFDIFLTQEEQLKNYDYIFYFNANCFCKKVITEEEFLPRKEGILFTRHPGFYAKEANEFTYDRNPQSAAYIPEGKGSIYIAGGLNGGKREDYLTLIHTLDERIKSDLANDVIARYHDESQINRYLYEKMERGDTFKLLDPGYCYPEGWKLPFVHKITILDKSRYFNDRALKENI